MTGLKKMIGLPILLNGEEAGHILRGVLEKDGRTLRGLVIRNGFFGARWLPRSQIHFIGKVSVIAEGKTSKVPKDAAYRLFRVTDAEGARLGIVTDALIHEETLRVSALEISSGPVDDLLDGRWFTSAYHVRPAGDTGHVTVTCAREEVKRE